MAPSVASVATAADWALQPGVSVKPVPMIGDTGVAIPKTTAVTIPIVAVRPAPVLMPVPSLFAVQPAARTVDILYGPVSLIDLLVPQSDGFPSTALPFIREFEAEPVPIMSRVPVTIVVTFGVRPMRDVPIEVMPDIANAAPSGLLPPAGRVFGAAPDLAPEPPMIADIVLDPSSPVVTPMPAIGDISPAIPVTLPVPSVAVAAKPAPASMPVPSVAVGLTVAPRDDHAFLPIVSLDDMAQSPDLPVMATLLLGSGPIDVSVTI